MEKAQVNTQLAENGRLGVEYFAAMPAGYYDVVWMNVRRLERPDARTIPIIAVTASAFDKDVQNCLNAGMNCHLSKPIEPGFLYSTIAAVLVPPKQGAGCKKNGE